MQKSFHLLAISAWLRASLRPRSRRRFFPSGRSALHRGLPLLLSCILLTGCGGESSSINWPNTAGTAALSGFVEDGPVSGARVFLRMQGTDEIARLCGSSGTGRCETISDSDGFFRLSLHPGANLAGLTAVATGGFDTHTGVDFSRLEMRAPLVLFSDPQEPIAITPVTTLAALILEQNMDIEQATRRIRTLLAMDDRVEITQRPGLNEALGKRTLLITALADKLTQHAVSSPFAYILNRLDEEPLFNNLAAWHEPALDQISALTSGDRQDLGRLAAALDLQAPTNWGRIYQHLALLEALHDNLVLMLDDESTLDLLDPRVLANLDTLGRHILEAAGSQTIQLGNLAPQRISRYVLFAYRLAEPETFLAEPEAFAALLQRDSASGTLRLSEDPEITRLAQSRVRYNRVVPLLKDEFLTSNARRVDYFYNSDASPFYQAEELLVGLNDAEVNDAVMILMVEGMARNGLAEEARLLAENQVFQSESKGKAFRKLAQGLIQFERRNEAIVALQQAELYFLRVIEAKGLPSINLQDIRNLWGLAADYRKAGDFSAALGVMNYLESALPYYNTVTSIGRLVVEARNLADDYIAAQERDSALSMVDYMLYLARLTPPNLTSGRLHYRARVFYLTETARRYADLGLSDETYAVYEEIQALRADDGLENLTADETWFYVRQLVEILYTAGFAEEAVALAFTIPATYVNLSGTTVSGETQRIAAFKVVATHIALSRSLDEAQSFIAEYIPAVRDQIEAWTYFAGNKTNPYIAQQAINKNALAIARLALGKARELVAQLDETTDLNRYRYLIQWGYAKLADLAWWAADPDLAQELLEEAYQIAVSLSDITYQIPGLVDIARVYYTLGDTDMAETTLADGLAAVAARSPQLDVQDRIGLQDKLLAVYRHFVEPHLHEFIASAREIYDPQRSYTGTQHDDLARLEAESLIKAADYLSHFAGLDESMLAQARALLLEAQATADRIFVPATRLQVYINDRSRPHLIGAYARARDFATARELAYALPYRSERHLALHTLAETYCKWDDLPQTAFASIDSDGDGRPDFFHPWAGEEDLQDLELDPDSDGDGIPDHLDARPLYRD